MARNPAARASHLWPPGTVFPWKSVWIPKPLLTLSQDWGVLPSSVLREGSSSIFPPWLVFFMPPFLYLWVTRAYSSHCLVLDISWSTMLMPQSLSNPLHRGLVGPHGLRGAAGGQGQVHLSQELTCNPLHLCLTSSRVPLCVCFQSLNPHLSPLLFLLSPNHARLVFVCFSKMRK